MLKIKSNVDLKELEKFGFHKYKKIYTNDNVAISEKTRIIVNFDYIECTDLYWYNDTLYDLIKADLVEKVSDKYEI